MNNIKFKYFKYIFKKNYVFLILEILLLSITSLFLSCVTYDTSNYDKLSYEDYHIYQMLGFDGITLQSYLFPLIFLIGAIVFLDILFNNLMINNYQSTYFLLSIKGYSKIKKDTFCFNLICSSIVSLTSLLLYFSIYSILNLIFKTEVAIFTFNINTVYLAISFFIYDSIINLICLNLKNKSSNLLKFLREKY